MNHVLLMALVLPFVLGGAAVQEQDSLDLQTLIDATYEEGQPLPADIQKFDGKTVTLKGFMDNYTEEGSSVFQLVSDACGCDGKTKINHFVEVTLTDEVTGYRPELITISGTLSVGEILDDEGFVTSVYRIEAKTVE